MRPSRMIAAMVKVRPWYYTERNTPSRHTDIRRAFEAEEAAEQSDD